MSRPKGCVISKEHREKLSKAAKARYENKEQRILASELAKKQWGKYGSEERKEIIKQIGFTSKGKSLSDESRRKISESNKGKVLSLETRNKISKANKGRVLSEEFKLKLSIAAKKKFNKEGMREKYSKAQKKKWETASDEDREKWIKEYIKAPSRHKGPTKIELIVENQLKQFGIKYKSQMYKIDKTINRGFVFDFYLPDYKLVVECNGWHHTLPEKIKRDNLLEEFVSRTNHKVLWLWASEICREDFDIRKYLDD